MKRERYYKVYYRCKVNGNGSVFAVQSNSKRSAIRATHIQMDMKTRAGYYAPACFPITEQEFNEHTAFNEKQPNVRW